MDLYIEVLDGQLKGSRTPLRAGLTIGRRDCDLNIEDSKVSGKHAMIELRPDGGLWIVDQGSANGIRVQDSKLVELALDPGVSFRLGRTNFKIAASDAKSNKKSNWRKIILNLTEKGIKDSAPQKKREVSPFPVPVRLLFKRGLQVGQEWTLGYGPREIGASSVDLPLYEPGLPAKCFKIVAKDGDVILKVYEEARGKIFLNGKAIETAFIRTGDVLEIANTRIEIFVGT